MRTKRALWTPVVLLAVVASACGDQSGLMGPEDVDSEDAWSGDGLRFEGESSSHAGDPVIYLDEDEDDFDEAAPGLPAPEDFENANVPDDDDKLCFINPVSSTSDDDCFPEGILPGLTVAAMTVNFLGDTVPAFAIVALGATADRSKRVSTFPGDFFHIDFDGEVNAVGLDLYFDPPEGVELQDGSVCKVSVFGTSDLLAMETVPCTPAGDFFGVTSTHVITRIEIAGPVAAGNNLEVEIDNIAFGPIDPRAKCMNGGWEALEFRNQGQCVRFVMTGKDSR